VHLYPMIHRKQFPVLDGTRCAPQEFLGNFIKYNKLTFHLFLYISAI